MTAEPLVVLMGEVRLDGRVDRMDGTWTGTRAAGQVERGTVGDSRPPVLIVPAATKVQLHAEGIIAYNGEAPRYIFPEAPTADCYWYETFLERLMRDVGQRPAKAS